MSRNLEIRKHKAAPVNNTGRLFCLFYGVFAQTGSKKSLSTEYSRNYQSWERERWINLNKTLEVAKVAEPIITKQGVIGSPGWIAEMRRIIDDIRPPKQDLRKLRGL